MSQRAQSVSAENRDTCHPLVHFDGGSEAIRRLEKRLERVEAHLDASRSVVEQQAAALSSLCCDLARMRRLVHRNRGLLCAPPARLDVVRSNWESIQMLRNQRELAPEHLVGAMLRVMKRREPILDKRTAMPRVCFIGDGFAGSWRMRAQQIARMRPGWKAKATARLKLSELSRYDVFVFVKRFDIYWAQQMRERQKVVIYDVVDPWKQPDDGLAHDTPPKIRSYFERLLGRLPVDGVIFPNGAMYGDLRQLTPNPIVIHHHFRPELVPAPVRLVAKTVGYEGREEYLGEWRQTIQTVCRRLGLQFVANPPSLNAIDIGFIARGGDHGSLMAKRYKSNVKLANMLAAGVPTVVQAGEESYAETGGDLIGYFSTPDELEAAVRRLLPFSTRLDLHRRMLPHSLQFSIEHIADQYEEYFRQLLQDIPSL
ncbi:MAG: hypothetical protein WD648_02730 [Planctomycetaceae bacterium]